MDWFERLTGFPELDYETVQSRLKVDGRRLQSTVNGKSYAIGTLELVPLNALRARVASTSDPAGRLKVSLVRGDAGQLHRARENAGALFQVASQFNLLEMTSPDVTPEDGVTRYQWDPTQGPACAMAAGAATIYRNYCVPVGDQYGQTASRQLDCIADLGAALSEAIGIRPNALWEMRNGYLLATCEGLEAINGYLATLDASQIDNLRGALRIGLHCDVEVTGAEGPDRHSVSQAFCSALPVAYNAGPEGCWEQFAKIVLEAAYEATLLAAVENSRKGSSNTVYLTLLGGGAFGNDEDWILDALRKAFDRAAAYDLDVRLVSHNSPTRGLAQLVDQYGGYDS